MRAAKAPLKSADSIDLMARVWAKIEHIQATISGHVLNECPPDAITTAEYAQRYNCSRSTARDRLKHLVRLGKMELLKVRIPDSAGRIIIHSVYRAL